MWDRVYINLKVIFTVHSTFVKDPPQVSITVCHMGQIIYNTLEYFPKCHHLHTAGQDSSVSRASDFRPRGW